MRRLQFLTLALIATVSFTARAAEQVEQQQNQSGSEDGAYEEMSISSDLQQELQNNYSHVDPVKEVPVRLLNQALAYYHTNKHKIGNLRYLGVVDFSKHSSKKRFYVVDMDSGVVKSIHVAHGKGSDPNDAGYATRFSNSPNSDASSLGFYMTGETYDGEHGLSLRLDGLSSSNSNVRMRDIVIHGADYVHDADVQAGRSWGCLAVPMDDRNEVVDMLKGGALIFAGR
jgi:L,D-transpeptidase catalytic domain